MNGKVALVTGAAGGIGRATALVFARGRAKVVVSDLSVDGGEETLALIQQAGGEGIFLQTDVSKAADVETLINSAVETYGRLDCAVNNAGIEGASAPTHEYAESDWDLVMNINTKGVFLCMKHELKQMVTQGSGAIVNTSSIAGLRGGPTVPAYVASKHAVIGLTKTAAIEYAEVGIRVNVVCPGTVQTPLLDRMVEDAGDDEALREAILGVEATPMKRVANPAEIAEANVWLCSDAASFVTGDIMSVDGGWAAG